MSLPFPRSIVMALNRMGGTHFRGAKGDDRTEAESLRGAKGDYRADGRCPSHPRAFSSGAIGSWHLYALGMTS
jgi:hypothetical protein